MASKDNFLVYGGIKFREGISKHAGGNWLAYPMRYSGRGAPFAAQCGGAWIVSVTRLSRTALLEPPS